MTLHVTQHAIQRYQERVRDVSDQEARCALASPVIEKAADFGAPYVRLGTGQRIVVVGQCVITVLPKDQRVRALNRRRDRSCRIEQ